MGISLSGWRAAIGTFPVKIHFHNKYVIPKQKFYADGTCFYGRKEWECYLARSKVYCKYQAPRNTFFGLVILSWTIQCILLSSGDVHPNPGPNSIRNFSDITMCHSNIRSLKQICHITGERFKLNDINCHLNHIDIITLSETWLTGADSSDDYLIPGYQRPFRRDRGLNNGTVGYGGVMAWVSDQIACKQRSDLECDDIEAMWLEIRSANQKFFVCTLYRTTSNSDRTFWDKMQDMITPLFEMGAIFYIIGDINADLLTNEGRKLNDFIESNSLHSFITEPTRITDQSSTILDQIVTNRPETVKSTSVEQPVSSNDHCTIVASLSFKKKIAHAYKRTMWDYKNANFELFRTALSNFDWNSCFAINFNVSEIAENWSNAFMKIAKRVIPNKVVTVRPNDKPWYSNKLRLKRKNMMKLYKKSKSNNSDHDLEAYKLARNDYFTSIRNAKKAFNDSKL